MGWALLAVMAALAAAGAVRLRRVDGDAALLGGVPRGRRRGPRRAVRPGPRHALLARDRLASDTVNGIDVVPARQAAAVAGAPRAWVVATPAGRTTEGRAAEGRATVERTTAGRELLHRERSGAVVVGPWGPEDDRGSPGRGHDVRSATTVRARHAR